MEEFTNLLKKSDDKSFSINHYERDSTGKERYIKADKDQVMRKT